MKNDHITKKGKIKLPVFVVATPNSCYSDISKDEPRFNYEVFSFDASQSIHRNDTVLLCHTEIEIEIPAGINLIEGVVDSLKQQQKDIDAEAHLKKIKIQSKIDTYLALEHIPDDFDEDRPF